MCVEGCGESALSCVHTCERVQVSVCMGVDVCDCECVSVGVVLMCVSEQVCGCE